MKKIVFMLLLMATAARLNAQQIRTVPDIKLSDDLQNTFKPNDWQSPQTLLTQPAQKAVTFNPEHITVYSTMPTVKTSNVDRMPVIVPGNPNVHYTMLIKKVDIIDPLAAAKKEQPKP
jgi:hypothetical protein